MVDRKEESNSYLSLLKIEDFLDYCAVLSADLGSSTVASLTRRYGLGLHGYLSFGGSTITMHGFFRKHALSEQEEGTFVQMSQATDLGSTYVADARITDSDVVDFIKAVRDVPSVVLFHPRLTEGRFELTFLFSRKLLKEVSKLITELSATKSDASISYLGKSEGISGSFHEISGELPLSFVEMQESKPSGSGKTEERESMGKNWLRIMKYDMPGKDLRYLYFSTDAEKEPRGNVRAVHEGLPLYETTENDPVLYDLESEISSSGILRILGTGSMRNGVKSIGIVMGSPFIGEYLRCVRRVEKKHPGLRVTLLQVHEVS